MSIGGGIGGFFTQKESKLREHTTVEARVLTAEERALIDTQNQILKIELEQITRQNDALAAIFPESKEILGAITKAAGKAVNVFAQALESIGETPGEKAFSEASTKEALDILQGKAPALKPEEEADLNRVFDLEERRGTEQLLRTAQEAADARQLRISDSPIANPLLREQREFGEGLAAAKAGARLDLGQRNQQFRESVRQFQEGLRFQAQQNRLSLTGQTPFALQAPIATVNPAQAGFTASSTLAALIGRPVGTDRRIFGKDIAWGVSGSAGAGSQGGGTPSSGVFSTARVKKSILPLDPAEFQHAKERHGVRLPLGDAYDRALTTLRETPVARWHYLWDRDDRPLRTGPILELSPEEFKEDSVRLDLLSYTGTIHAGLKALDRKMSRLAL